MELRHWRYFEAVASEEHMRRAAERLRVAQPALTRQIADLEAEIGYPLFERLPRGLRLNAAGTVMLKEARAILERVEMAVERGRRAAQGEIGSLKIGFIEAAVWMGAFPKVMQDYRARWPEVGLELLPMSSRQQMLATAAGEIDGGFCYGFEELGKGCEWVQLRSDRVVLAAPRRAGWKKKKRLKLRDLAGEAFVGLRRAGAPRYLDTLMEAVVAGGLSPRVVQEVVDETTLLSLVAAGVGLGFVNSAQEGRKPAGVDFVDVNDLRLALPLYFVWRKGNGSPTLAAMREAIARAVQD